MFSKYAELYYYHRVCESFNSIQKAFYNAIVNKTKEERNSKTEKKIK